MEEDMKLVKKDCQDVKVENSQLRKTLEESNELKKENLNLTEQLKKKDFEAVKAMKAIEERIEEETNTAMKSIERQINVEVEKKIAELAPGSHKGKKEFIDLEKEYKKKLAEVKEEKDKILEDLAKLQAETDLSKEKIESIEKNKRITRNLKLFDELVKKDEQTLTKDECIREVSCEGDCENVNQLKRLNSMKQSGSDRSCPQTQSKDKPMLKCDKCDFISQNKEYFSTHMKGHEEKKIANNVKDKRPCHFVGTRRGCIKGDSCNFDHSKEALAKPVVKVYKLCQNKEACAWKPRCKYIHPEDGDIIPAINVATVSGGQDFGLPDISQQPPGWSSLPAPRPSLPTGPAQPNNLQQVELERRTNVIEQFLKLIVPNLMCLTEFPNLGRKQNQ